MNAYEIPDAIQWHEGLLLTPQHFQQLSSRHEALVQYGTSLIAPFCWGVRRFKHHAISLPVGKLRVLELEAVMPDGLVVVHGLHSSGRDDVLEIDLNPFAEQMGDEGAIIQIAVPARQHGNGDALRYQSFTGDPIPDEISSGKPRTIHRLKPRLTLHVAEKIPSDYVGFPLARVVHKDSSFALDDKFIPPLLTVPVKSIDDDTASASAKRLGQMCSQAAMRVRKRAMYLADEARSRTAKHRCSEDELKTLMLSLVGALPGFEAVLQTGCTHPYLIYVATCNLVGHLAVLSKEMVPPAFAPYNHNDLNATFEPVFEFVDRAMDHGVPVSYKTFVFRYHEGAYEIPFEGTWMKKRLALGIKGTRGMSEDEVVRWGESCLIGSQSRIELLRANRIRGAVRKHAQQVGDIVTPNGVALFSLKPDESFVEPEKLLQIVNLEGPRPSEITLYVMDN